MDDYVEMVRISIDKLYSLNLIMQIYQIHYISVNKLVRCFWFILHYYYPNRLIHKKNDLDLGQRIPY